MSDQKVHQHARASDSVLRTNISPAWLAVIINMMVTIGSFIWFAATLTANTRTANETMTRVVNEIKTLHATDSLILTQQQFNTYRISVICAYIDGRRCPTAQ